MNCHVLTLPVKRSFREKSLEMKSIERNEKKKNLFLQNFISLQNLYKMSIYNKMNIKVRTDVPIKCTWEREPFAKTQLHVN